MIRLITFCVFIALHGLTHASPNMAFDDWSAGVDTGDHFTATNVNSNKSVFGFTCQFGKGSECFWNLSVPITCEAGALVPALATTKLKSIAIKLHCFISDEDGAFLAILDTGALFALVSQSTYIGFSIPDKNLRFDVQLFSLEGMVGAVAYVKAAYEMEKIKRQK